MNNQEALKSVEITTEAVALEQNSVELTLAEIETVSGTGIAGGVAMAAQN